MTAKKPNTRKGKGRTFQQRIVKDLRAAFPEIPIEDITSTPLGVPGADVMLSNRARELFPFYVECKHQENITLWQWIRQAEAGAKKEKLGRIPLLIFRHNPTRNTGNNYAIISREDYEKFALKNGFSGLWVESCSNQSGRSLIYAYETEASHYPNINYAMEFQTFGLRKPMKYEWYVIMRWEYFLNGISEVGK